MKVGIVSDTHGRPTAVRLALAELADRGIRTVLHCGDIDDAETVRLFRGLEAHFVFGNCDGDRAGLRRAMGEWGATLHEPFGHLELEGVRIAFVHGDDARLLRDLETLGVYDFVFYGHTHVAREHRCGGTRVINPGALHRARPRSFAVLDLETREAETVEVPG
jgi:putative phosphoesterase